MRSSVTCRSLFAPVSMAIPEGVVVVSHTLGYQKEGSSSSLGSTMRIHEDTGH
jgi:hypothetical protein